MYIIRTKRLLHWNYLWWLTCPLMFLKCWGSPQFSVILGLFSHLDCITHFITYFNHVSIDFQIMEIYAQPLLFRAALIFNLLFMVTSRSCTFWMASNICCAPSVFFCSVFPLFNPLPHTHCYILYNNIMITCCVYIVDMLHVIIPLIVLLLVEYGSNCIT